MTDMSSLVKFTVASGFVDGGVDWTRSCFFDVSLDRLLFEDLTAAAERNASFGGGTISVRRGLVGGRVGLDASSWPVMLRYDNAFVISGIVLLGL
jgi:hypothetical protein